MYSNFYNIEELKQAIVEDKKAEGIGAVTRNRYPIRFILLDNFRNCYELVEYLQIEMGAYVESVDRWVDAQYPDYVMSHVELAENIDEFISKIAPQDGVIAPFSELARFYDNEKKKAFDALLKTIKAIEASADAVAHNQRIYIPVVGLEGKMESFSNDTQTTIWRLHTEEKDLNYRLILTDRTTFDVKGLEPTYTIVRNIREWLNIWKNSKTQVTSNIICTSRSIFANAIYAQPDNAFVYQPCETPYEFLTSGLQLAFGGLEQKENDNDNWEQLASLIDISNGFSFSKFVKSYFGVDDVNDYKDFIKLWFEHHSNFDRWLLARYYVQKQKGNDYLSHIIEKTEYYATNELLEHMAEDISTIENEMSQRQYCLNYAAKKHVTLSESAENKISKTLEALPAKMGYTSTLKYFTGIAKREKDIALNWLGKGLISINDVRSFFPDLYTYAKEAVGVGSGIPLWVENYMRIYKKARISNSEKEIEELIQTINKDDVTFDAWYQQFKSTRTLLTSRKDIEVFFWIDGLGIEWIPLVKQIVAERKEKQIFLNDIKIAKSLLPTVTSVNKEDLQKLLPEGEILKKSGDIDEMAHQSTNTCPHVLIEEIAAIREIIEKILDDYIGTKIAIISDHGLTYMSQLANGLNLAGIESDHHGRLAFAKNKGVTGDSNYIRLEDGKTLCALKHTSLCAKTPTGQGAHGGCTPEEVLVPIFIISSSPADTSWTADLVDSNIMATNPRVQFKIKNLASVDKPIITYNNKEYALIFKSGDLYESEALQIVDGVNDITLTVGDVIRVYHLSITTAAKEENLFDF